MEEKNSQNKSNFNGFWTATPEHTFITHTLILTAWISLVI